MVEYLKIKKRKLSAWSIPGCIEMPVTPEVIIASVFNFYGTTPERLRKEGKKNNAATEIRHVYMYLLRKHTKLSYAEIGRVFDRDHATAKYAEMRIEELLSIYSSYRRKVEAIRRIFLPNN